MYFTGAKFVSNHLMGTGDVVIFILLCKIIYSFIVCQHAHNRIIMYLLA